MTEIVNIAQLEVLGFKKEYFNYVIFFFSLLAMNIIFKPLIKLLSTKQYLFVLTYVTSSLLVIVVTFVIAYYHHDFTFVKTVLQTIIFFSATYIFYLLYKISKKS